MAATKPTADVDICNLALDHLNQPPITSIDTPNDQAAEICARWYHTVRGSTLRKHPWNFATKRRALAETTSVTIPFGFSKAFALPSDFVRVVKVGDEATGQILTDGGALNLRYVYDITDVNKFDALFVEIFAYELAIRMARKFSRSDTDIEQLKDDLKKLAPAGYAVDGQERPPSRVRRSKWISARRRRTASNYGSQYVTFDAPAPASVGYQLEDGYILTGDL